MNFLFFTEEAIRGFLALYGRGPQSRDYELLVAVLLKKFCEKQFGTDCLIGFKLQDRFCNELPRHGTANIERIAEIIRRHTDHDTPIDVAIVPTNQVPVPGRRARGPAFQIKRYREGTEELIAYLNGLAEEYAPVVASLVLIFETNEEINFREIKNRFVFANFPFVRAMFISLSGGQLCIGEFWPNEGMDCYDPSSFIGTVVL